MSTDDNFRRRSALRQPMLILGAIMTLIYLVLGIYLLVNPDFLQGLPAQFRQIFAGLLLIYGIYRGWRIYADHF